MQAGRLRYDFEQRILQSARDARRQMVGRIEITLAGVDAAIASGVAAQRRGERDVAVALARSRQAEQSLAGLEAQVKALESAPESAA